MKKLFPYPFVRLIIPLIAGIMTGAYSNALSVHLFAPEVLLWLCLLLPIIYPGIYKKFSGGFHYLLYSLVIIFLLGYFLSNRHFSNIQQQTNNCKGDNFLIKVSSLPVEKDRSIKITADVFRNDQKPGKSSRYCGKGLFYIEKDSLGLELDYGDVLLLMMQLIPATNNGNPGEFDYRSYLNRKGIIWRSFVPKENWHLLQQNEDKAIKNAIISYRSQVLLKLKNFELGEKELSVAAAMLLGYDEILDRQTRQAFSDAGAMHILCVSGLHVGIIYVVLNFLLSFLKRVRYGRTLQMLIIIILIWMFAGLTGMQAPVLRASIMFSFLAFGKLLNRQAYIYNTLAASAFIILLFDPMALFNAGFQLSYAAVIFIVWLHNPLYRLLPFNFKFGGKIWSLICVSIAATIGTLPLVLHYFNQFPLYFILTNLFVVPLSFMIVGTGIVFMLFPFFAPLNYFITKLLNIFLQLLNRIVCDIHNLPNAGIENLYLSTYECILLYLLITLLAAVMIAKKLKVLKYALLTLLLLVSSIYQSSFLQSRERKIIIYNIGKGTAIDLIAGSKHYLIADSVALADKYSLDYNIKGNWIKNRLTDAAVYCPDIDALTIVNNGLSYGKNMIVFNNYKLIILDANINKRSLRNMYFDAALIKQNMALDTDSLSKILNCPLWITEPSVSGYNRKRIQMQANAAGIVLFEMNSGGAFIRDI